MAKSKICKKCGSKLKKDWIALNKKFFGRTVNEFVCISCMAEGLGWTVEDLEDKIEEFKEDGCDLF